MAFIDTLVNISISDATAPVSAESLSVPLLISDTDPGWTNDDVVRSYGTVAELIADGASSTSNLAVYATRLMGGNPKPSYFLVGKKADNSVPGQGALLNVAVTQYNANAAVTVTVNGHSFSSVSTQSGTAGAAENAQNLAADFQGIASELNCTVNYNQGDPNVNFVANPGFAFTHPADGGGIVYEDLRGATQGTSESLTADDLDAFVAANNSFYAIIPVAASDADIQTLADWVEGVDKTAWVASASANNGDSTDTSSVAAYVKGKSYRNTAVMFSPASATKGIEAAWAGVIIPQTPGAANPAYQTLAGISADAMSTGQLLATVGNLVTASPGNRANVYISQYSQGITLAGTTGASTIYEVMGVHWLKFQMRAAVFSVLKGQKTALTDRGVAKFTAAVRGVLAQGVTNGLIDPAPGTDDEGNALPGITVTAPSVGTLTAAQKAGGVCPPITFTCTLAGPINAVSITGVLEN